MYKTDNAPIRLSYHHGVHYNSVVDPYTATVGVGLGLAGHKPGVSYFSRNTVYLDLYHLKTLMFVPLNHLIRELTVVHVYGHPV